jgi:hypothetical protein
MLVLVRPGKPVNNRLVILGPVSICFARLGNVRIVKSRLGQDRPC